jgi:hypothetical protein
MRQVSPGDAIVESSLAPVSDAQSEGGLRLSKRQGNIYTGFDLPSYVLRAFAQLTVNVDLVSTVNIGASCLPDSPSMRMLSSEPGDFVTALTYSQTGVPVLTDSSLNLLLPVLAQPIVQVRSWQGPPEAGLKRPQKIVDGAVLSVDTILITDPQLNSFGTTLTGSITNSGPFDAVITFTQGLTVSWNGAPLGQIAMPNVSLVGDVGATLNLQAAFSVANVGTLTDFTGYLLNTPSFTWQVRVLARRAAISRSSARRSTVSSCSSRRSASRSMASRSRKRSFCPA